MSGKGGGGGGNSSNSSNSNTIGVNLRVTGHCNQGGRKYMEDVFSVAYQQTDDEKDLEYAFFGIFDGHGGKEAAIFAKDHLMTAITKQKNFWSEDDDAVLRAIRDGFLSTQSAMWADQPNWARTAAGHPSTAGTTASVCFIKRGKIFIGHCGDSGIVLGEKDPHNPGRWRAKPLTTDHKPESKDELDRIQQSGGKVVAKNGVPRVVWYRPSREHQGPVRRSTPIDEVPFLAVARALGDLWSYNAEDDVFIVSPEPDLHVYEIDKERDRCLVLATDGAWNVLDPDMAIKTVHDAERNNERHVVEPDGGTQWMNPSKRLVDLAITRWELCKMRADNTSIVTVILDPPGPPRAEVLRKMHGVSSQQPKRSDSPPALPPRNQGQPGVITRVIHEGPHSPTPKIVPPSKLRVTTLTSQQQQQQQPSDCIVNHPRLLSSPHTKKASPPPPPLPEKTKRNLNKGFAGQVKPLPPRRRSRGGHNSDTENDEMMSHKPLPRRTQIKPKIRELQRLHQEQAVQQPCDRVLRPRNLSPPGPAVASAFPTSGKRKRRSEASAEPSTVMTSATAAEKAAKLGRRSLPAAALIQRTNNLLYTKKLRSK